MLWSAIVHDLGTGTIRTSVAHSPEVILLAHARNARGGYSCHFLPQGERFIILDIDRGVKAVLIQLQNLSQELPRVGNGFTLEIVTKGKITQHFEEGMVTR